MVSLPKHRLNVPLMHVLRGEEGLSELADQIETVAHQRPGGKFGKRDGLSPAVTVPADAVATLVWSLSVLRAVATGRDVLGLRGVRHPDDGEAAAPEGPGGAADGDGPSGGRRPR